MKLLPSVGKGKIFIISIPSIFMFNRFDIIRAVRVMLNRYGAKMVTLTNSSESFDKAITFSYFWSKKIIILLSASPSQILACHFWQARNLTRV